MTSPQLMSVYNLCLSRDYVFVATDCRKTVWNMERRSKVKKHKKSDQTAHIKTSETDERGDEDYCIKIVKRENRLAYTERKTGIPSIISTIFNKKQYAKSPKTKYSMVMQRKENGQKGYRQLFSCCCENKNE